MVLYRCHKCAPSYETADQGLALCHMIDEHRMLVPDAKRYLKEYSVDTDDPITKEIGEVEL